MTLFQLLVAIVLAENLALSASASGPQPGQIKNLVTFGDSYTDTNGHDDGGTLWPVFAAEDGNFTLFPFAKVGATCSNALTPRPSPSIFEAQLPAYFDVKANGSLDTLKSHDTMYTLWIGTNDFGANALLTGGQTPGVTVVDTVTCAVDWVRALYDGGAWNSIFQNMIPLETVPLYAPDSHPSRYVKERTAHLTPAACVRRRPVRLALSLRGHHVRAPRAVSERHRAIQRHRGRPRLRFPGERKPARRGGCTDATDPDSFLWYDELHPSVQSSRAMPKAISDAIRRQSKKWITWLS